ncbi:hypothetical protein [Thalassomonas actiniarum]|uniref:Uncharacterized protein n=1 Tax=Thalassomonas actiniarum TaxID=485447 RepID=A0AAE9YW25_9GAMM|nr:hypothetical protein [Thalassomonas actiniarum]WDE01552.1 hypothetical protein SG35_013580 [Thalassomonas actiniarum]
MLSVLYLLPIDRCHGAGMKHIGFSAPSTDFVYRLQKQIQVAGFEVPEVQDFNGA